MINFQTFAVIHQLETEKHIPVAVEQTRSLPLDGKIMYLKELVGDHDAIQQVDWIAVAREVDKYAGI